MLLMSDLSGGWTAGAIDPDYISIAQQQDAQHFSGRRLNFRFNGLESREVPFGVHHHRLPPHTLLQHA